MNSFLTTYVLHKRVYLIKNIFVHLLSVQVLVVLIKNRFGLLYTKQRKLYESLRNSVNLGTLGDYYNLLCFFAQIFLIITLKSIGRGWNGAAALLSNIGLSLVPRSFYRKKAIFDGLINHYRHQYKKLAKKPELKTPLLTANQILHCKSHFFSRKNIVFKKRKKDYGINP